MRAHLAYACGAFARLPGRPAAGRSPPRAPRGRFGRTAAAAERALWRDHRGAGAAYTALCVAGAAATAAGLARVTRGGRAGARSTLFDRRGDLDRAGRHGPGPRGTQAVAAALDAGELAGARRLLPHLCGRDPQALDADGDRSRRGRVGGGEHLGRRGRAPSCGARSPGFPGMAAFRAVNTLDAMVGHRSPRYRRFGWAAARLDDVAGWPGARLTAAARRARRRVPARCPAGLARDDAGRHPSPNAGPVEAAFAGALGLRLGGTLSYGGRSRAPAGAQLARARRAFGGHRAGRTALAPGRRTRAAAHDGRRHGRTVGCGPCAGREEEPVTGRQAGIRRGEDAGSAAGCSSRAPPPTPARAW